VIGIKGLLKLLVLLLCVFVALEKKRSDLLRVSLMVIREILYALRHAEFHNFVIFGEGLGR
jgi:hypothetical protein